VTAPGSLATSGFLAVDFLAMGVLR